jgi:NAD(P)-dependent dehydrogenase (short-subunit alcohol dehydrogenase family)
MLLMGESNRSIAVFKINQEIKRLVKSRTAFKPLLKGLTPDHIVYYGLSPVFIAYKKDLKSQHREIQKALITYRRKYGSVPKIAAVENTGIFAISDSKKSADTALELFLDAVRVIVYAKSFGGLNPLKPSQADFINRWEAEAYRRKIAVQQRTTYRLREKIALVTGGAQGFGRGIAESLIKEGANVVIADINHTLAVKAAAGFCEKYGKNSALAVKADVSKEDSVKQMIIETVINYGGMDLLVSNAGILKAGSLEELSARDFDAVTRINYSAYFLCAKYASSYMKLQQTFKKDYFSDIVQINSKSGLQGSRNNSAYAGSKFGGIGLTQSFALELVDYNIKVNSICPGNLFDGPLWSDPINGLFSQYLKVRKVPGAKNIKDVRRYYESQAPVKRGCTIEDVAKAIFYVIDQKYETGQALPVTGGQVMLP